MDGGAGVQENGVPSGSLLSSQDGSGYGRVLLGASARQIFLPAPYKAVILRVDDVGSKEVSGELADCGGSGGGDLIQTVLAVDHHAGFDPQVMEDPGQGLHQRLVVDSHQLHGGAGGIGQGAEDIEDGGEGQGPPDRGHILHGQVIVLGEHKADAGLF